MTKAEKKRRDNAIQRELKAIHRGFYIARVVGQWRSQYAQTAWSRLLNCQVREQTAEPVAA